MNKITFRFFICLLLLYFPAMGQEQETIITGKISKLTFDVNAIHQRVLQRATKNLNSKNKQFYADYFSTSLRDLYEQGYIITDMPEVELYLNDILQVIIPDSLKGQQWLHVYLSRFMSPNAFCYADGTILFNIGLFASVNTEAGIATIIGHELSHYIYNDCESTFIANVKAFSSLHKKIPFYGKIDYLNYLSYSREQETRADSVGCMLAFNAKYDILELKQVFTVFKNMEIQMSEKSMNKAEKYSTHPLLQKRINTLNAINVKNQQPFNKFIVSEEKFEQYKYAVLIKGITIFLNNGQYSYAIESAFRSFLLYPEKPELAYLNAEAIRRLVLLTPKMKDYYFLYYLVPNQGFRKPSKRILSSINTLIQDSLITSRILSNDIFKYTDSLNTYNQFFKYFISLAENKNYPESFFTDALYNKNDTIRRNALLVKYLTFKKVQHAEYATSFMSGKLLNKLSIQQNHVLILDRLNIQEIHETGKYDIIAHADSVNANYISYLKVVNEVLYSNRFIVSLDDSSRDSKYVEYLYFKQLIQFFKFKENSRNIVFELNPDVWNYMIKNNLQSIEYIGVNAIKNKQLISSVSMHYLFGWLLWPYDLIHGTFKGSYSYKFSYVYSAITPVKMPAVTYTETPVGIGLNEHTFKNVFYHFLSKQKLNNEE